ncbi:hypothetical protein ACRRTK_000901 [Alexandromys fortis]
MWSSHDLQDISTLGHEVFIGFMGNSLLFILYMYAFLIQPHLKKPIDMIFTHLTLVNVLSIVFRLIPDVMASFAVKLLFHDVGCKAVLYAYSVTRGLSICTILLLSAFQAITVSPTHSKWAWLKPKLESCILPSLLFIWIINTCLYIPMVENVKGQINFTVVGSRYPQTYCRSNQGNHQEASNDEKVWVSVQPECTLKTGHFQCRKGRSEVQNKFIVLHY